MKSTVSNFETATFIEEAKRAAKQNYENNIRTKQETIALI